MDARVVQSQTHIPASAVIDLPLLRSRIGDDAALERELLALYLRESDERLAAIRDGLERSDAGSVALAAHALRGSAGNIGAHTTHALATSAEAHARTADLDAVAGDLAALEAEQERAAIFVERAGGRPAAAAVSTPCAMSGLWMVR